MQDCKIFCMLQKLVDTIYTNTTVVYIVNALSAGLGYHVRLYISGDYYNAVEKDGKPKGFNE